MIDGLSIESLAKGEPARLVGADDPRILITGLHGDETLAARMAYFLHTEGRDYLAHVDYVCGNPDAAARGLRHGGHDLNRSFDGPPPPTASEAELQARQLAHDILDLICAREYDYVLDLHTSDTETEGFFLISRRNQVVDRAIGASTLEHVAVMPPTMIENTLMGATTQTVAIEYARADEGRDVEETARLIENLLSGVPGTPQERQFFGVTRKVTKDEDPGDVPNFVWCEDGYYPILLGKESDKHSYRNDPHTDTLCFAAETMDIVAL